MITSSDLPTEPEQFCLETTEKCVDRLLFSTWNTKSASFSLTGLKEGQDE